MAKIDKQTSAVYSAEDALRGVLDAALEQDVRLHHGYGSTFPIPLERKFSDLRAIEIFLNRVLQLGSVRSEYGDVDPVTIKETKRGPNGEYQSRGHYSGDGVIRLSPHGGGLSNHLRESYILHELAHHMSLKSSHGQRWTQCYLFLLENVMSVELAALHRIFLMEAGAKI